MTHVDAQAFPARFALALLAAGATWFVAYAWGSFALRTIGLDRNTPGWRPIAAAAGYALLGSALGVLALAHLLAWSWQALAVFTAIEIYLTRADLARFGRRPVGWLADALGTKPDEAFASSVTCLAILFGAVAAALPAVWWDPIAYHLPIVAAALARGTFAFDPGMIQTGFPLLGEATALPAYAIAGSAGPAMVTLGAGIVFALLCGAWADSIVHGSYRVATAIVACSALWLWLAPSFYVDVPFAMLAVAALHVATRSADLDSKGAGTVAGICAGAAASVKYPGMIVVVLAAAIAIATSRSGRRVGIATTLIAAAAIVAVGWYVRSLALTGDPMYPFLTADAGHAFAVRYVDMTRTWCGGGTSPLDAVTLPWRLLTQPAAFCGDPGYALDLGAIFALASLALGRRIAVPAISLFVLTAVWFWTSQQWRFLLPAVGIFGVLAAAAAVGVSARLRPLFTSVLVLLCAANVVVDVLPATGRDASNGIAPAYAYIAGRQTASSYLSGRLESFDADAWLQSHASGEPVAALDDVRDYYEPDAVWCNPFYQSACAIDWSAPPQRRYAALMARGIRYVIVDANPAFVQRTPTGVDFAALASDERMGVLVRRFAANDVFVDEIASRR